MSGEMLIVRPAAETRVCLGYGTAPRAPEERPKNAPASGRPPRSGGRLPHYRYCGACSSAAHERTGSGSALNGGATQHSSSTEQ